MVVYASLFGVGAPEALVIGVVALLVFGPKGLAEVSGMLCIAGRFDLKFKFLCESACLSFVNIIRIAGLNFSYGCLCSLSLNF